MDNFFSCGLLLSLFVVNILSPRQASAEELDRQSVIASLSGYEWTSAQAASQLGPEGFRYLLALVQDEAVSDLYRARAVAALGAYPRPEVFQFYVRRLNDVSAPVERRRAAEALCGAFRESAPGQVEDALVPLLGDDDAYLRVRAAACLNDPAFAGAREAVQAYRKRYLDSWEVRAAGLEGSK